MFAARTIALLTLAVVLFVPLHMASHGNSDAGGADAGNTRASAKPITNGVHVGNVGSGDGSDWYKFHVSSITGDIGSPLIDIQVRSDGGWGPGLNLYGPGDTADNEPRHSGRGSGGFRVIRASADDTGDWLFRVTGAGHYELRFFLGAENDLGLGRDAPASLDDSIPMPSGAQAGTMFFEGSLTPTDDGDSYSLPDASRVVAALFRSPGSGFGLEVAGPGGGVLDSLQVHEDDHFVTAYMEGNGDGWGVRVSNPNGAEGTYRLIVRSNAPQNLDGDTTADTSDAFSDAAILAPGLRHGRINPSTDQTDIYRIPNVQAGQILRLGVSSHSNDGMRPQVAATLYDPQRRPIAEMAPCQGASGHVRTANQTGTWYLAVREGVDAGECDPLTVSGAGSYAMALEVKNQNEAGPADAPATVGATGDRDDLEFHTGWLDDGDTVDTYPLGVIARNGVVRVGYQSLAEGLVATVRVVDEAGTEVGSVQTSNGAAGLEATTSRGARHFLQIARFTDEDNPPTSGQYRFLHVRLANQPPVVVSLAAPPLTELGANTVRLSWSRSPDADFQSYEIHQGRSGDFVPNADTRKVTITNRTVTTHTVSGLQAGQTYTFLIRVVDTTGLTSDSNRRTITTKPLAADNTPPTLDDGAVSPTNGGPSTLFTYSVVYTDADNNTPTMRRVYIDGAPVEMSSNDTTYEDGAEFVHSTTLAPGVHSFFFEFSDGISSARDPSTGTNRGPEVTRDNNAPPRVTVTARPTSGPAPLRVEFTANASDDQDTNLSYAWDFDNSDGFSDEARGKQATHTYTQAGTFTATVRVSDRHNATSTDSVTITVTASSRDGPRASPAASPASGLAPLHVQFRANAQDPDGRIASYSWDFDNSDGLQNESTQQDPTHTYARGGSYTATVTVRDDKGNMGMGSVSVLVRTGSNQPPTIRIHGAPTTGDPPLNVSFEAAVGDPDGEPVTVSWDFDLSNGVQNQATGERVTHTFPSDGTYTVLATARDGEGATATDSVTILVGQAGPLGVGPIRIEASPAEGKMPLTVTFRAVSDDPRIVLSTYDWDFGDGTPHDDGPGPSHTYERMGRFTVVLRATDSNGTTYAAQEQVVVSGKPQGSPGPDALFVVAAAVAALAVVARRRQDRF